MRSPPWNEAENGALVALYFAMLDKAQAGASYNKAQMIRDARCLDGCHQPLIGRSKGSIEMKLMNASAAHIDLNRNAETMEGHGYRALPNYQANLRVAMANAMNARSKALGRFEAQA